MRGIIAAAILVVLAGCAVSLANVVTATESSSIQIVVDGHTVGTLELLEYHLDDGVIEITTTEGIKGVQCDVIFRDCFEARD